MLDGPPLKTSDTDDANFYTLISDTFNPNDEDSLSAEFMFEDENTTVGVIPVPSWFNMLQTPYSSMALYNFGLSSFMEKLEGINITSPHLETTLDGDQENPTQGNKKDNTKAKDSKIMKLMMISLNVPLRTQDPPTRSLKIRLPYRSSETVFRHLTPNLTNSIRRSHALTQNLILSLNIFI